MFSFSRKLRNIIWYLCLCVCMCGSVWRVTSIWALKGCAAKKSCFWLLISLELLIRQKTLVEKSAWKNTSAAHSCPVYRPCYYTKNWYSEHLYITNDSPTLVLANLFYAPASKNNLDITKLKHQGRGYISQLCWRNVKNAFSLILYLKKKR